MAENKGGILLSAKKSFLRKKTQVLQSLGKTGKTTDDLLTEDCARLEKQQEVATKFQKDLRHYIQSARSLANASKQFYATASETYETEWDNHEQVTEILKNMDNLWEDYLQKLNDQIQDPLTRYLSFIPQIKSRIAKRGRKLIDYDNAKHNLEVQQNAKKKDDAKIQRAQEEMDQAKTIYEALNEELHQELPEFYTSRLGFYGNVFQNLFTAESVFYSEAGKGSSQVAAAGGQMATDNVERTYTPRKSVRNTIIVGSDENLMNGHNGCDSGPDSPQPDTPSPSSSPTSQEPPEANRSLSNDSNEENKPVESVTTNSQDVIVNDVAAKTDDDKQEEQKADDKVEEAKPVEPESAPAVEAASSDKKEEAEKEEEPKMNGDVDTPVELPDTPPPPVPSSPPPEDKDKGKFKELATEAEAEPAAKTEEADDGKKSDDDEASPVENNVGGDGDPADEGLYAVPPPAKPVDDFPPGYIYTVTATHKYASEDDDEISFDANETIYVLKFENPEEQDPGWLMGMKSSTREVGVFPQNFTKNVSEQANNMSEQANNVSEQANNVSEQANT